MWASRTSSKFTYEQITETKHQVNVATGKISSLTIQQSNLKAKAKKSVLSFLPSQKRCTRVTTSTNLLSGEERRGTCVCSSSGSGTVTKTNMRKAVSDLRTFISFHYSFSKYLLSTYYVHRHRNMFQVLGTQE